MLCACTSETKYIVMHCLFRFVVLISVTGISLHVCAGNVSESVAVRSGSFRCEPLDIPDAIIRYRRKNRVAKIRCKFGTIITGGDRRLTCIRARWMGRIPHCISAGCAEVDFDHGQVTEMYSGALIHFHCNPGYRLHGSPALFCNGRLWNDTVPECIVPPQDEQHRSCTFEYRNICGWTQDHMDDYDWKWSTAAMNALSGSLGAKVDKTYDTMMGHYIYADSKDNWDQSKKARIFSPFIETPISSDSCITFYYHMNGPSTGSLSVYLKEDNIPFELLTPQVTIEGNHQDQWNLMILSLADISSDHFQVVLEAWGGDGHVTDIAVDDFQLRYTLRCMFLLDQQNQAAKSANSTTSVDTTTEATTSTTSITSTTFLRPLFQHVSTCRFRCGLSNFSTMTCDCHPYCEKSGTCCDDFHTMCSYMTNTSVRATTEQTTPIDLYTTALLNTSQSSTTSITTETTRRKIFFIPTVQPFRPTIKQPDQTTTTIRHRTLTPSLVTTTTTTPTTSSTTTTSTTTPSTTTSTTTTTTTKTPSTTTPPPTTEQSTTTPTTTASSAPTTTVRSSTTDNVTPMITHVSVKSSAVNMNEEKSSSLPVLLTCLIIISICIVASILWIKKKQQTTLYAYADINTDTANARTRDASKDTSVSYQDMQTNIETYVQFSNSDPNDDHGTPV